MLRKEKVTIVDELKKKLETAKSIFLTDFTGINVKDISELRRTFQKASVEYLVAKNTLVKRAVAETPLQKLDPFLTGPTALVISEDDGAEAAKIISRFAEGHQSFAVKVGLMTDKIISPDQVKVIACLPAREILLARLLGSLHSPISNFVFILHQTTARVVRALDQVRQAKESQSGNN